MGVKKAKPRNELSYLDWRKSTRSGPNSDNCVEVAYLPGGTAVRDSKDPTGPVLVFGAESWRAFLSGAGSDSVARSGRTGRC